MAQSRFKFNSASNYVPSAVIASDSGVYTQLTVDGGGLKIKTTSPSPYEGSAYIYIDNAAGGYGFVTPSYFSYQTEVKYLDFFYYDTRSTGSGSVTVLTSGEDWHDIGGGYFDFLSQYISVSADGTLSILGGYFYYNPETGDAGGFSGTQATSSAGAIPTASWCRIRVRVNINYLGPVEIYKGSNILGSTPDVTLAGTSTSFPSSATYPNYLRFGAQTPTFARFYGIDDLYISNITWPTREVSGPIAYGPSIRR